MRGAVRSWLRWHIHDRFITRHSFPIHFNLHSDDLERYRRGIYSSWNYFYYVLEIARKVRDCFFCQR